MQWLHREKEALEQANLEKLRREGFPEPVIARLYDLRRDYGQDEQDQPALDRHRLEFARWLVFNGRLTDDECH